MFWTRLSARRSLLVRGPDARSFLHGLFSNDVRRIFDKESAAQWGGFMNGQGKVLCDAHATLPLSTSLSTVLEKDEPSCLFEIGEPVAESLTKHLQRHMLDSKVAFTPLEKASTFIVFPPPGTAALTFSALSPILSALRADSHTIAAIPDARDAACLGIRVVSTATDSHFAAVVAKAAADGTVTRRVDEGAFVTARAVAGLVEGPVEIPPLTFRAGDTCLDALGVAYDKGCFVGQEPTARAYNTGSARRRALPLMPGAAHSVVANVPLAVSAGPDAPVLMLDADLVAAVEVAVESGSVGPLVSVAVGHVDVPPVGIVLSPEDPNGDGKARLPAHARRGAPVVVSAMGAGLVMGRVAWLAPRAAAAAPAAPGGEELVGPIGVVYGGEPWKVVPPPWLRRRIAEREAM